MLEQRSVEDEVPRYPTDHAFIVQFQKGDLAGEAPAGRVEHIVSGGSSRFQDNHQLMDFLASVLRAVGTSGRADESVAGETA
jgi:hypothetical protein